MSLISVWSRKKSFKTLAFSVSLSVTIPSFSNGGIEFLEFGAITFFSVCHQSLEESVSVLSLSAILSLSACFDSLIKFITLFLRCLNLTQLSCKLVCLAFLYALFRFLIICLNLGFIHAGSSGLIRVFLFGIHSFAIVII